MRKIISTLGLFLVVFFSKGQNVGIGTTTPHPSAAMDIADSTKGILIPRMTMSQRNNIQNPAEGLMVYQTDSTKGYWYFDGFEWNGISKNININSNGTSVINYFDTIPPLYKFIGDGREGSFNSQGFSSTLYGEHYFSNFIVPEGSTLNISHGQTTVIHVKDTCIINGTINGEGYSFINSYTDDLTNRLGACGENNWPQCFPNVNFSWNETPLGLIEKIGFYNKSVTMGPFDNKSQSILNLWIAGFFSLNISGLNSCINSGKINEGGAGIIIVCKNIIFNGMINLKGGNGSGTPGSSAPCIGAGGGGSAVISYENSISNTGIINTNSGTNIGCYGGSNAGSGKYLFIDR